MHFITIFLCSAFFRCSHCGRWAMDDGRVGCTPEQPRQPIIHIHARETMQTNILWHQTGGLHIWKICQYRSTVVVLATEQCIATHTLKERSGHKRLYLIGWLWRQASTSVACRTRTLKITIPISAFRAHVSDKMHDSWYDAQKDQAYTQV